MSAINLTDDQMWGLLANVIKEQMAGEQRDKLITDAISNLLVPQDKGGYNYNKCFERAVYTYATETCRKYIDEHPEVQEKVLGVVAEAFKRTFEVNREELVTKVSGAVSEFLYKMGKG